jgi:hypothetical protein
MRLRSAMQAALPCHVSPMLIGAPEVPCAVARAPGPSTPIGGRKAKPETRCQGQCPGPSAPRGACARVQVTRRQRVRDVFQDYLLPQGYPDSVAPQYGDYMFWRGVQYFFGGACSGLPGGVLGEGGGGGGGGIILAQVVRPLVGTAAEFGQGGWGLARQGTGASPSPSSAQDCTVWGCLEGKSGG